LHLLSFAIAVSCCAAPLAAQTGFVSFDAPDASEGTYPIAINQGGAIAGYYFPSSGLPQGFVRSSSGVITEFSYSGGFDLFIAGINEPGQIVGTIGFSRNVGGFLRNPNGSIIVIQPFSAPDAEAKGINDSGQIVGYYSDESGVSHGFLRNTDGTYVSFDAPGAGTAENQGTIAVAINGSGMIMGYFADTNTVYHGFIRDVSGRFTEFSAPGAGTIAFRGTFPAAINSSGEVVGYSFTNTRSYGLPFVRPPSGPVTSFVAPESVGASCVSVTDNGEVVCEGARGSQAQRGFGILRNPTGDLTFFSVPVPNLTMTPLAANNNLSVTGWYSDLSGGIHGFLEQMAATSGSERQ
jgi:probable HAF family extracellular repeat protein